MTIHCDIPQFEMNSKEQRSVNYAAGKAAFTARRWGNSYGTSKTGQHFLPAVSVTFSTGRKFQPSVTFSTTFSNIFNGPTFNLWESVSSQCGHLKVSTHIAPSFTGSSGASSRLSRGRLQTRSDDVGFQPLPSLKKFMARN